MHRVPVKHGRTATEGCMCKTGIIIRVLGVHPFTIDELPSLSSIVSRGPTIFITKVHSDIWMSQELLNYSNVISIRSI